MTAPATRAPAMQDLLPHRAPMILLDQVIEFADGRIECALSIRASSPFCRDGRTVAAVVALELMAQSAAAWLGMWAHLHGGAVGGGYLIGVRELNLEVAAFDVGDRLQISAAHVWGRDNFMNFECEVHRTGQRVAHGTLNVLKTAGHGAG